VAAARSEVLRWEIGATHYDQTNECDSECRAAFGFTECAYELACMSAPKARDVFEHLLAALATD
jgi:hypothetical protein